MCTNVVIMCFNSDYKRFRLKPLELSGVEDLLRRERENKHAEAS